MRLSLQKSLYSYSQYHWCPIAFTVRSGLGVSSNKYKRVKEGNAIWIKITPGISVQTHSIICPSNKFLLIMEENPILTIINLTKNIIKTKMELVKSWK